MDFITSGRSQASWFPRSQSLCRAKLNTCWDSTGKSDIDPTLKIKDSQYAYVLKGSTILP